LKMDGSISLPEQIQAFYRLQRGDGLDLYQFLLAKNVHLNLLPQKELDRLMNFLKYISRQ
jgi:hypothetical protein